MSPLMYWVLEPGCGKLPIILFSCYNTLCYGYIVLVITQHGIKPFTSPLQRGNLNPGVSGSPEGQARYSKQIRKKKKKEKVILEVRLYLTFGILQNICRKTVNPLSTAVEKRRRVLFIIGAEINPIGVSYTTMNGCDRAVTERLR